MIVISRRYIFAERFSIESLATNRTDDSFIKLNLLCSRLKYFLFSKSERRIERSATCASRRSHDTSSSTGSLVL